MRKIISKKDEKRKNRRNQLIIGAFLVLVMGLSTIGYSINSKRETGDVSDKLVYNNLQFTKISGLWNVKTDSLTLYFTYSPNEVNKTSSTLNSLNTYSNKPLYISSENSNTVTEIYRNLVYANQIALRMQEACLENETCEGDFPKKTCSDNFIIIQESNESMIKQDKNCVFIYGKKEELVKLTDSFLYKITGIQ